MTVGRTFRHWLEWRPWRVIIALGLGFALYSVLTEALAGALPTAAALAIVYLGTAVFLLYALVTIVAACRVRVGPTGELGLALACLAGMFLCRPPLLGILAVTLNATDALGGPIELLAKLPGLWALGNSCIILAAAFLGRLIGRLLREASLLPVVAVVAAGIDLWGVYWGPVGHLTTSAGGKVIAQQFSAAIPGAGAAARTGLPILAGIGIGDFLFLALFFSALRRLRLNQAGAFWFSFALMLVAPAFFLLDKLLPIASNLPGLPFIALGMIVSNWRHWKFTREEVRSMIAAALIIAAVIAAIIVIKRLVK